MISVSFRPGQRRSPQVPDNNEYFLVNWRTSSNPHVWHPPTDVYEREESIDVRVEIAGMAEDNFSISLEQNVLVIRGVRPDTAERRAYHQMEINFGEFLCTVEIQVPIDSDHVRAEYQNGFLWVILPKSQPKVIKVKENE
jgi:HSP20 family protein